MKPLRFASFILILSMAFTACKKEDPSSPTTPEITGTITGKVVSPNNRTPIRHALVFVSTNNQLYSTYTDTDGNFSLTAEEGNQNLHVQTGHGDKFRTILPVSIIANQTTALSDIVRLNQVANFAYVAGSFDKIESILIDTLGYNAASITNTNLQNIAGIVNYDAIFINCGAYNAFVNPNTDTALGNFVAAGGSLYLSDYSMNFLTGQYASATDCSVDRTYGFIPDATVCSRRIGTVSVVPQANIVSQELQYFLGKNNMNISYNLGSWERIQQIDNSFWQTLVTDPTDNSPLLIRTNQYTNSNQIPQVVGCNDSTMTTVCHQLPNGSTLTLSIPVNALPAHLAHGDTQGSCNNPGNSGWIYFTTFHNEHNGLISEDVKHILEYMILNL